jgi:hypothetical protein
VARLEERLTMGKMLAMTIPERGGRFRKQEHDLPELAVTQLVRQAHLPLPSNRSN